MKNESREEVVRRAMDTVESDGCSGNPGGSVNEYERIGVTREEYIKMPNSEKCRRLGSHDVRRMRDCDDFAGPCVCGFDTACGRCGVGLTKKQPTEAP